jgi:hypothetical protein
MGLRYIARQPLPLEPAMKKPAKNAQPTALVNAASNPVALRLSDDAFAPDLAALQKRLRDDPAFGQQLLRQAGIVNTKGRLSRNFGG